MNVMYDHLPDLRASTDARIRDRRASLAFPKGSSSDSAGSAESTKRRYVSQYFLCIQ